MLMGAVKPIISVISVCLTFVGYIPYIRDTIQKKTVPHVYSWLLWSFVTAIAFALQFSGGAGVGAWVTLAAALVSFFIFFLGLRNGKKDISRSDTFFFILSLIALILWLVAKRPILSVILVSITEMLAFIPTFRKSWNKPYSETLFTYELNAARHGLSIFALQYYSIVTWLYPVTWTFANALFSVMLLVRRKHLQPHD